MDFKGLSFWIIQRAALVVPFKEGNLLQKERCLGNGLHGDSWTEQDSCW